MRREAAATTVRSDSAIQISIYVTRVEVFVWLSAIESLDLCQLASMSTRKLLTLALIR